MKNIFENILEIGLEVLPLIFFIAVFAILIFGGQMSGWLSNIASWMFG